MSYVVITGTVASEPKSHTFEQSGKTKLELRVLDGKVHHTCIAWETDATFTVGDAVLCEDGRIGYRSYEKDGTKVWVTEFTFQRITKLGSINAEAASGGGREAPSDLGFD